LLVHIVLVDVHNSRVKKYYNYRISYILKTLAIIIDEQDSCA
jgi:hypothetical protein